MSERETIHRVLQADLANAQDNIIRCEMQQKRMPFDRDNNDALVHYKVWAQDTQNAIKWLRGQLA